MMPTSEYEHSLIQAEQGQGPWPTVTRSEWEATQGGAMSQTTTFHTTEGTVRYAGIRRYIVVKNGETIKRTDSLETAEKVSSKQGGIIVDTVGEQPKAMEPADRICSVCSKGFVPADDYKEYKRHWHCIPRSERDSISAQWREARAQDPDRQPKPTHLQDPENEAATACGSYISQAVTKNLVRTRTIVESAPTCDRCAWVEGTVKNIREALAEGHTLVNGGVCTACDRTAAQGHEWDCPVELGL